MFQFHFKEALKQTENGRGRVTNLAFLQSLLVRNGNELRRSLRRINSLTRRKLSPSNSSASAAAGAASSAKLGVGGSCKVRKNSRVSIKSDDGAVQDSLDHHETTLAV